MTKEQINYNTPLDADIISFDMTDDERIKMEMIEISPPITDPHFACSRPERNMSRILSKSLVLNNLPSPIKLRAICERGLVTINTPIPDIIPKNVWLHLPDVFKEELVSIVKTSKKKIPKCKNMKSKKYIPPLKKRCKFANIADETTITYIPSKSNPDYAIKDSSFKFSSFLIDIIVISKRWHYDSSTNIYNAKTGLVIESQISQGL